MTVQHSTGVRTSAIDKACVIPKGRQTADNALVKMQALLGTRPRHADLLIEFLHLIQAAYGNLSTPHRSGLGTEYSGEHAAPLSG